MKPGQFIDMNARRRVAPVVDLPPSSYRPSPPSSRPPPEPDRSQIDMPLDPPAREATLRSAPEPPATEEPADVAVKRKKRVLLTGENRAVAVARVDKLIEAGNPAGKAVASVAKEMGVSESAVINWRTAARKGGKKKASKKKARAARAPKVTNGAAVSAPAQPGFSELGQALVMLLTSAVGEPVRLIVREEIRRMLS